MALRQNDGYGDGRTLVQLKTKRLLLRPFETADVEDSLEYRNDPEFARYLSHVPQPFTRSDAEEFVRVNMTEPSDQSVTFAIVLDGKVIGSVNLEIDQTTQTAMLGYGIGRAYWGLGLTTEAAMAVLEWGFGTLNLTQIWASTSLDNLRSQRVLQKLGMSPQRWTIEPKFAVTKEEWLTFPSHKFM
jgi:RimJ/RimL family protein N-acetyltransferase